MRILVTGTTGFVGRHIVAALVTDGHDVHGLVRSAASASSVARSGVRLHEGDMRAPDSYRHLIPEVDAVIHAAQLATAGRVTAARARSVFAADQIMTTALADGCLQHGRRLVYTPADASTGATEARTGSTSRPRCRPRRWESATPGWRRCCPGCTRSEVLTSSG